MIRLILYFLCAAISAPAFAQTTGQLPAYGEQWQLTLDVIKTRAQSLLIKNNDLADQAQELNRQIRQLQGLTAKRQAFNDGLQQMLKQRTGKTDQQIRYEEVVAQLKTKKAQQEARQQELNNWNKQLAGIEHTIGLKKLKISELQLQQDQRDVEGNLRKKMKQEADAKLQEAGADLAGLRKQLEDAQAQEALLERDLSSAKEAQQKGFGEVKVVEEDNKKLAARLEELRVERAQKETIASTGRQATVFTKERYNKLRERKLTLESQISLAEAKAATLKRSMLASNQPWPEQKKTLIHEMVQADARNSQLREKVGGLREDIDILRDKIGKLERRLNFTQGKGKPK